MLSVRLSLTVSQSHSERALRVWAAVTEGAAVLQEIAVTQQLSVAASPLLFVVYRTVRRSISLSSREIDYFVLSSGECSSLRIVSL